MNKYKINCGDYKDLLGMNVIISGNKKEITQTLLYYATIINGHKDTNELRKQIRKLINSNIDKTFKK